jgi:hypothetical protein
MDGAGSRSKREKGNTPKATKNRARSSVATRRAKSSANAGVSADERHQMIALAAYYRAEQRGFMNGDPRQDWLEAENEVTMRLAQAKSAP